MTCPLGGGCSIQLSYGGYMRDEAHYKPLTERDKPIAGVARVKALTGWGRLAGCRIG